MKLFFLWIWPVIGEKLHSIRIVLASVLVSLGVTNFYFFWLLDTWWSTHGPKVPDPIHGFIILHEMKGYIAYFSVYQHAAIRLLFYASIPICFIGMLIVPRKWDIVSNGRIGNHPSYVVDDPLKLSRWGAAMGIALALLIYFLIGPPFVIWTIDMGFWK